MNVHCVIFSQRSSHLYFLNVDWFRLLTLTNKWTKWFENQLNDTCSMTDHSTNRQLLFPARLIYKIKKIK